MRSKTLILLSAAFAAFVLFVGCKSDDRDDLENGALSEGGIAGSMQGWNKYTAHWTHAYAGSETYDYEFTSNTEKVEWKVLKQRGNWNGGAYRGNDESKETFTIDLKENKPLQYDGGTGGGGNCITGNLVKGEKYKIRVIYRDGTVSASVTKVDAASNK